MYAAMDNFGCFSFDSSDYINEIYSISGADNAAQYVEFDASLLVDNSEGVLSAVKEFASTITDGYEFTTVVY
jgi:hypothetical protein